MSCIVEQNWVVRSPNGKIGLIVSLERGKVYYQVKKEDRLFIERSPLGIVTDIMDLSSDLIYNGINTTFINETYRLVAGKKSIYTNCANELTLKLRKGDIEFSIDFRVYDDGIGYRYSIPGSGEIKILSEASTFTLPSNGIVNVWAQTFMKCYEYTYNFIAPEDMIQGRYAFPILVQVDTKNWMLITEAAVYGNYCGCHVMGSIDNPRRFNIAFAPDQEGPIISERPFVTPWRTVVIGGLSTIVETSLIENLNPPCELDDVSWIKPGRAAWPWFTNKNSCSDLEVNKDYVDFTASMGWEYLLIDAGWQRGLDVPELVQYADKKGVGIWLWVHSKEMQEEEEVRKKLSQWSKWGVKGIKVDFFDSDSQKIIKQYDMIAKVAAEYKLMVNFHGSTKPSGEQRRWPHILTRE